MDNKHIFKTDELLLNTNDKFLGGIVKLPIKTDSWNYQIGTPILFSQESYLNSGSERISILLRYPQGHGCPVNNIRQIKKSSIYVTHQPETCYANNHLVKNISNFEIEKFDSLIDHVKKFGSITLMFDTDVEVPNCMDAIKYISSKYKIECYLNQSDKGAKYSKDRPAKIAMDIVNLNNVFSIFNPKKCDGIVVMLYVYYADIA